MFLPSGHKKLEIVKRDEEILDILNNKSRLIGSKRKRKKREKENEEKTEIVEQKKMTSRTDSASIFRYF